MSATADQFRRADRIYQDSSPNVPGTRAGAVAHASLTLATQRAIAVRTSRSPAAWATLARALDVTTTSNDPVPIHPGCFAHVSGARECQHQET